MEQYGYNYNTEKSIKYETNYIMDMIQHIYNITNKYTISHVIRKTNKKIICVIKNIQNETYIMKAKLKDFLYPSEIDICKCIKKLSHPNLNKIIALYETPTLFIVISEYIEGVKMAETDKKLNNQNILLDVVSGIKYLHENNIIHGDITPNNIIITNNGCAVIIDYDNATFMTKPVMTLGTCGFTPPEYNINIITNKADIWMIGMTFYLLSYYKLLSVSSTNEYMPDFSLFKNTNYDNAIRSMISSDYKKRPELSDVQKILLKT